jgi:hypothetical protein
MLVHDAVSPAMRELLAWLARCPRTYQDTMDVWQTSCPRSSVWEDAMGAQLVEVQRGGHPTTGETRVVLTRLGEAVLRG